MSIHDLASSDENAAACPHTGREGVAFSARAPPGATVASRLAPDNSVTLFTQI